MTKIIIPEAALQQHVAVLGKTGSGKTFAAKAAIVEPLLERGRRVGVVDPTGAWWGLRSSRDGKGAGFPILVLGGEHGDLPLPANGGEAVAKLLTEQGVNLVADTSSLTVGEAARWFIDFAGALYRLNRQPLHLVLDEAHNFAPQGKVPDPDTGKMLHAANRLASGGRSRGIRLVMITQRPQKLHKDALTSADTLIAMRVLAPHDREAVEDWIKGCGDREHGKEVLNSLASLQRGEGSVWYTEGHHLTRARFPQIRTFDSSATPEDGHAIAAPKAVADVNLEEVRKALAEAMKEAEANDPKLLRARIVQLEIELKKKPAVAAPLAAKTDTFQLVHRAKHEGYLAGLKALEPIAERVGTLAISIAETIEGYHQDVKRLAAAPKAAPRAPAVTGKTESDGSARKPAALAAGTSSIDKPMPRAMLAALAQHPDGLTKGQILVHTGYRSSGPVSACFAELARQGWTEPAGDRLRISQAGMVALGPFEPLPVGAALREHLLNGSKCSGMEKAMLKVLFNAYPDAVSKGDIIGIAGYKSSGPVSAAFARMVALGYAVQSGRGRLTAAKELFSE